MCVDFYTYEHRECRAFRRNARREARANDVLKNQSKTWFLIESEATKNCL